MRIPSKRELQQIAINHSANIDFKDFINYYKKCIAKPYSLCSTMIEMFKCFVAAF